jgi:sulfur relay (sulfurtransferase) complex TusBCD TusD component (DsrE family)
MDKRWDLLMVMTGAPHGSDVATTALRLAQAVLDRGGTVRMWTCGYATMLTQTTHGATKPKNTRAPDTHYPSPAALIGQLLADHDGRLGWIGCTACSAERGATNHIEAVRLRSPQRFVATIGTARKTVFIGGA